MLFICLHVLDQAIEFIDPILSDELGLDALGGDDLLPDAEPGAIVGELVAGEFRGDGLALIADEPRQSRERGDELIGIVGEAIEVLAAHVVVSRMIIGNAIGAGFLRRDADA